MRFVFNIGCRLLPGFPLVRREGRLKIGCRFETCPTCGGQPHPVQPRPAGGPAGVFDSRRLIEQADDFDEFGTMDDPRRFLGRDELIGMGDMSGCQVKGVHCSEAGVGSFRLRDSLNLGNIPAPSRFVEISLVKQTFQPLLVEDRLGQNLKADEWAGQEYSIRLLKRLQRALPVPADNSASRDQHACVAECPDHEVVRNSRPGDSLFRAQARGGWLASSRPMPPSFP